MIGPVFIGFPRFNFGIYNPEIIVFQIPMIYRFSTNYYFVDFCLPSSLIVVFFHHLSLPPS